MLRTYIEPALLVLDDLFLARRISEAGARLMHRASMLEFEGKSYRLKEAAACSALRTAENSQSLASRPEEFTRPQVEEFEVAIRGPQKVEALLKTDAGMTVRVNNAGIGATEPQLQSAIDAIGRMIAQNVTGATRLAHTAMAGFMAQGRGTLINIASIVAITPEILNGVYGGSTRPSCRP